MPQSPPERKLDSTDLPRKASVVPFERPQNDAQRTVRKRVQERLDHEGVRIKKPRTSPTRLVLTLAVALIPVVLTFTSADAILRRIQLLTRLYTAPHETKDAPAATESEDPGVVIMMPDPELSSPSTETATPADRDPVRSAHAAPKPSNSK
jgi:hypothetical protein